MKEFGFFIKQAIVAQPFPIGFFFSFETSAPPAVPEIVVSWQANRSPAHHGQIFTVEPRVLMLWRPSKILKDLGEGSLCQGRWVGKELG